MILLNINSFKLKRERILPTVDLKSVAIQYFRPKTNFYLMKLLYHNDMILLNVSKAQQYHNIIHFIAISLQLASSYFFEDVKWSLRSQRSRDRKKIKRARKKYVFVRMKPGNENVLRPQHTLQWRKWYNIATTSYFSLYICRLLFFGYSTFSN